MNDLKKNPIPNPIGLGSIYYGFNKLLQNAMLKPDGFVQNEETLGVSTNGAITIILRFLWCQEGRIVKNLSSACMRFLQANIAFGSI